MDNWDIPEGIKSCIICAAITGEFNCKRLKESRYINIEATVKLVKKLSRAGIRVIFLSSDIVNKKEGEYTWQKRQTENKLVNIPNSFIIRLPVVNEYNIRDISNYIVSSTKFDITGICNYDTL
jgi:dTDP-4-dehydrorhamnose reductase